MDREEVVRAVRRMQDHIHDHVHEPITLGDLAKAAGYSPWHAARCFKELTGKTPFDYLRAYRLSRAAVEIWERQAKIVDVALDFVFDSHEGFTRAFHRQFGMSPRQFGRQSAPIRLFMPHRIRGNSLLSLEEMNIRGEGFDRKGASAMSDKKTAAVFVQVVERPARKAIVKRGVKAEDYYQYCEEVGCEVWDVLTGIREALYEPAGMWMPDALMPPDTSRYVQGVEVSEDYAGEVPEGYELIDLPACKLMVFQGQPYDDANFEEAISDMWEVMKTYNPEIYGYAWADDESPRIQLEPQGYRGYIEARPVRPLNK